MRRDIDLYRPDPDAGGYRYIGKYYRFPEGGAALALKKRAWLSLSILSLAAFLAAGLLDQNLTRAGYVVLPYAASLLPMGYAFAGALSLMGVGDRLTEPQWKRGYRRLLRASFAAAVLSALALAGAIVFMALSGAFEPGFPACAALAAGFSFANLRILSEFRPREDERGANAG